MKKPGVILARDLDRDTVMIQKGVQYVEITCEEAIKLGGQIMRIGRDAYREARQREKGDDVAGKKKYTHDSVQRALIIHEVEGRVRTWSPPEPGEMKYRIDVFDYGTWEGSLGETAALVVGMRAGSLAGPGPLDYEGAADVFRQAGYKNKGIRVLLEQAIHAAVRR